MNDTKKKFDQVAANWDQGAGRQELADNIARTIIDSVNIKAHMNVLDFGCGTGLLTLNLQPLVRLIIGVDSSAGMLDVLNKKIESQKLNNIKTQLVDIQEDGILEGTFDMVVSSMTLHHIQDLQGLFQQFSQVIPPGGLLCLADLDLDEGMFHQDNKGVFHFGFDREIIRNTLERSGFDVIHVKTAAMMTKIVQGGKKSFSVFLIIAQRREI